VTEAGTNFRSKGQGHLEWKCKNRFCAHQGATVRTMRTLFFPITYERYAYVILPYVYRTLTSFYDVCVSYLQQRFTKVSTEYVVDSCKRKQ